MHMSSLHDSFLSTRDFIYPKASRKIVLSIMIGL